MKTTDTSRRLPNKIHLRRPRTLILATGLLSGAFAPIIPATAQTNGSIAYTYDALGRVLTASYDTGVCIIYTYDANGNRLKETIGVSANGVWGCFNWNTKNWGN